MSSQIVDEQVICHVQMDVSYWATICREESGRVFIALGGEWDQVATNAPTVIEADSEHFEGFKEACESELELAYIRQNF